MHPRPLTLLTLSLILLNTGNPVLAQKEGDTKLKEEKKLITPEAEKAIAEGLTFLTKEQAANGSWGKGHYDKNPGVTSLCGLAFLASGHVPGKGEQGKLLERAIQSVLDQEDKEFRGFLRSRAHGPMYGHGFGTQFLAEALLVMPGGEIKDKTRETLERAVKVIVSSQAKEGGWRYVPTPRDADISVTCCQMHALLAAQRAGIEVPGEVLDKGRNYVAECQEPKSGGFRYQRGPGPVGLARTSAGLSVLLTGKKDAEGVKKGIDFLKSFWDPTGPKELPGEIDVHYFYGRYYATLAFRLAGGKDWSEGFPIIREEILGRKRADHSWFDGRTDPHYCTAMALLALQMPRAHLSILKGR